MANHPKGLYDKNVVYDRCMWITAEFKDEKDTTKCCVTSDRNQTTSFESEKCIPVSNILDHLAKTKSYIFDLTSEDEIKASGLQPHQLKRNKIENHKINNVIYTNVVVDDEKIFFTAHIEVNLTINNYR